MKQMSNTKSQKVKDVAKRANISKIAQGTQGNEGYQN
jgi:hypothetical protein